MNVLVKSTYPQKDSWGMCARDYMRSFYMTNHDVRSMPVTTTSGDVEVVDWLRKPDREFKPEIFFQQCPPTFFERANRVRNIGFTFTESKHLEKTGWIEKLNEMDEVWVATKMERETLISSGVDKKIMVVPMPLPLIQVDPVPAFYDYIKGKFSFYFVGEYSERKNIEALISAYWREFTRDDNVVLFIKTNFGAVPPEELAKIINKNLDSMRSRMRLHQYSHYYPEIIFMTENLQDVEVAQIHATCNCFVTASRGESTCRPLIDAAYYNKPIICTDGISCTEDLDMLKVRSMEVPCSAFQPPTRNLYTGYETWMEIDTIDLQSKMRHVYNTKPTINNRDKVISKHSYESVSERISNIL